MQPLTRFSAVAIAIDQANFDTDQIIPARFLKYSRGDGYGQYLFHDLRFDEAGEERPDFVLNRPETRAAGILVAERNFGCGSSREGAIYALVDYGFRVVIAPSFGDIFHNNCLKNGVLPIRLEAETAAQLRQTATDHPGHQITVDLEAQVMTVADRPEIAFTVDPFWREALMKGLDELDLTLELLPEIEAYEQRHLKDTPWLD